MKKLKGNERKILSILLIGFIVVGLTGCVGSNSDILNNNQNDNSQNQEQENNSTQNNKDTKDLNNKEEINMDEIIIKVNGEH